MTILEVVNQSTLVPESAARQMAEACEMQIALDLAPAWGLSPVGVVYATQEPAETDHYSILLVDDADQAGALGYHDETPQGRPYARVFARPVLNNGGSLTTGPVTVSSVLSHEVCETFCDLHVSYWAQAGAGTLYALEVADPVEQDGYSVNGVVMSNFVYPAWFDAQAPQGSRFDQMELLTSPFSVRKGGYAITQTAGTTGQVFGDEYPAWRASTKAHPAARTARRMRR